MISLVALRSEWRREALRTNLWMVPTIEVVGAVALYFATHALDKAAYAGSLTLPSWMEFGTADAARQILTTLAAAVITVVGVVFSITIVTLTLASTQFGPRMLRNFIRDRGTQFTLGTFVATFVYATLVLISIGPGSHGPDFVPHLSITIAVGLVTLSMAVLIYFIHHIAMSIQLPQVIASIAKDLSRAIDAESSHDGVSIEAGPSVSELLRRMDEAGGAVTGSVERLPAVRSARDADRTGGREGRRDSAAAQARALRRARASAGDGLASSASDGVSRALRVAHITGPSRTLAQDLAFAVDQLVEIAIRALSPAVNDTFTALTCIDWLGESLCKVTTRWRPLRVHRDSHGYVRVITAHVSYRRLVERAFEKIRQAGRGMPAVQIRQLEALAKIVDHTTNAEQRELLLAQAAMILRASEESVPEPADRADVLREYENVLAAAQIGARRLSTAVADHAVRNTLSSVVDDTRSALVRGRRPPLALGVLVAVALVGICTGLVYPLKQVTSVASLGVVYLVGVVIVSAFWGVWLGLATSMLSAAAFNFFHLPPVGRFTIADSRNWVALAAFFVAAVATEYRQRARARSSRRGREASSRGGPHRRDGAAAARAERESMMRSR